MASRAGGPQRNGMCLVEAATGRILWGHEGSTRHVHGQGMCSDVDARHAGAECYSADTDDAKEVRLGPAAQRAKERSSARRTSAGSARAARGGTPTCSANCCAAGGFPTTAVRRWPRASRGHVAAVADILGDWREEIITSVPGELRIYSTTIPATDRRTCLMQDPIYRIDVAHAAMGYFQTPMIGDT